MTSGSSIDLITGQSSVVRSGIKYVGEAAGTAPTIRNAVVHASNNGIEEGREVDEIFVIREPQSPDETLSYNDKFPAELREEMLARVASVRHLYGLRLVCKAWYGVIMSANLARLHAARAHDEAWLLVAKPTEMVNFRRRDSPSTACRTSHAGGADDNAPMQQLIYYNIVTCPKPSVPDEQQQWIAPSTLPYLQADVIQDRYRQLDLSLCKSHGGLVCCILMARRPWEAHHSAGSWARLVYAPHRPAPKNTILVFNPITKAYKVLPTPPAFDWSITAATLHTTRRTDLNVDQGTSTKSSCLDLLLWRSRSTGQFKVAICNRILGDVRVFDSRKGLWTEGSRPPGGGGGAHGRTSIRPRLEGFRDSGCREKIYWYDVGKDEWLSATLPTVTGRRAALRRPSVFKAEDVDESVMLAALLQPDGAAGGAAAAGPRSVSGFGVWKLAAAAHVGSNASNCSCNSAMSMDHSTSISSACISPSAIWVPISTTPPAISAGRVLRRLNDSKLICHSQLVCLTGLLRFSPCPWNCFYPRILTFNTIHRTWKWLPQPLGRKTWAKFHVVSLFTPNLECIP